MKEKTLRYPGHIEKMAVMRETGFFSKETIEVDGNSIRPIDVTASLLFPMWERGQDEVDITVLQVIVEGAIQGKRQRYVYDLLDKYDPVSGTHSMARTTGYAATMAIRMLAAGLYDQNGISPPEFLGRKHDAVEFMLEGLEKRGVVFELRVEDL
jgi:saccharopine dehydrogenase-like NADP-dependent oxidoreductase